MNSLRFHEGLFSMLGVVWENVSQQVKGLTLLRVLEYTGVKEDGGVGDVAANNGEGAEVTSL